MAVRPRNFSTKTSPKPKLKIPEHFYEKSDYWGYRPTLRLLGVLLVWIILLSVVHQISPLVVCIVAVTLGIAISKITLLVQEADHDILFKTEVLNQFFGRLGGWWTGVDFFAFQALHRQHHAYVGVDDDPQLLGYGAPEKASRKQLAWHLFRPLIGWNIKHMAASLKQRISMERD